MFQLAARWHGSKDEGHLRNIDYTSWWRCAGVPIQLQSVFFKRIYFRLRFFSLWLLVIYTLHWFSSFYDVIAFFFFQVYQFLQSYGLSSSLTLWVVYVNNNNKTPEASSLFPVVSHWPLFSLKRFYLWLIFFFPSHWQFSDYCASSSDFLTLSWLKN